MARPETGPGTRAANLRWPVLLPHGSLLGEDNARVCPFEQGMVMTTAADIGFVEMRLDKVVGISTEEDHPSFFVVLDGVSEDRQLPILIGDTEAIALSASLTWILRLVRATVPLGGEPWFRCW